MSLYNANGQINLTSVAGTSYTGLYAADGSWNIVINTSSTPVGLYHPCGALNAVVVANSSAGYYAANGSMNVIFNGTSYSPAVPAGSSAQAPVTFSSTNGVITTDSSGNTILSFPADDVLFASSAFTADVLAVGGGAGGGTGGGGGAGQVLYTPGVIFGAMTPIRVGLGGAGSTASAASSPGGPSIVAAISGEIIATGGSAVGIINTNAPTTASGSGGGTACSSTGGPYSGGPGGGQTGENPGGGNGGIVASPFAGGGGGGAGAPGTSVSAAGHGGNGGNGIQNSITGTATYYGGGGAGISFSNGGVGSTPGTPGLGGGGAATNGANGTQGTDGLGGGGGGAFNANTGGKGGKGQVILRLKGNSGSVLPTIQPITVDQTNLAAYYGVTQLSTWAGSCLQITRASDSTTLNIGFVNNVADFASADAFGAGTTYFVSKIYDQSGNGKDLTTSNTAGAPTNVGVGFSGLNTWFGVRPITFQGVANSAFQFANNTTFTLNSNALSVYQVAIPHNGRDFQGYFQLSANTGFTTADVALYHTVTQLIGNYNAHTTNLGYERATLGTMSSSYSGTTGAIYRINGTQTTNATAASSTALVGLQIGSCSTPAASGTFELFSLAVYAQADTSTQMIAKEAAFTAPLNMQTLFSNRAILGGSSLWGYDSTLGQTPAWQGGYGKSSQGLIPTWEPIVMGIGGQTVVTEAASSLGTYISLIDNTKSSNIVQIDAPSNDIINQTFTSQAQAQTYATNLYNNTTLPFVAALLAGGFNKVIVPTCIARGAFTTANFQEYARLTYNSLVVAGASANNYTCSDRAGFLLGGTAAIFNSPAAAADTTYYFTGGTHLTNLGYWYMGSVDRIAQLGF